MRASIRRGLNVHLISIAALVGQASLSHAQWSDNPEFAAHAGKGIDYVYNLYLDSARTEFQHIVQIEPDHPAGHFFLAMVEWWNILLDIDDESRDENYFSTLDKVIDVCDKRLEKDEDDLTGLFFKGGALGFQGRLHANRGDWVKAANDGRQALPIVQKVYKIAPNNYDVLLGIGIYNYYAAVVPEQYPFVKPFMIFFPSGDKEKGIHQLRDAAEHSAYANIEASYFLLQLYFNYEKQYHDALPIASKLYARYPNNVVFHKYVGRCYASLGRWNEMRQTFTEIIERVKTTKLGYTAGVEREAVYYLGLDDLNAGNYEAALQHLYRCDELSRNLDRDGPSGFMVMANLKIGMAYDRQEKRQYAIEQYNKVLKMNDYQNAHKQAEQFMKTPYGKF